MNKRFVTKKIRSLEEYCAVTAEIKKSWSIGSYDYDPWFRGVSSHTHLLLPSFYRPKVKESDTAEGDLRDEFERRAHPLLEGPPPTGKWDWYFLMQHYGLPTRLLDWSESSLVGLYFAVADWKGTREEIDTDVAVWMLDPWFVNRSARKGDEVFRCDDKQVQRYLPDRHWDTAGIPKLPIAVMPRYNSRRITAQKGNFTLHGTKPSPLEELLPARRKPRLAKLVIPWDCVKDIDVSLRMAGITDVVVFPELTFLCRDIGHSWGV